MYGAALKSGSIDASVFNAPFGNVAKKFNFNILADAGALGIPYFNTGMCGSAKVLQKNEGRILNFLRAYLEAIKIFKTEPEYTLKALSQFSKVNDHELLKEAYEYNRARIPDVPYPSVVAMQAVVDTLAESEPKAAKADAKYLFLTEPEAFDVLRKRYRRELRGVSVVSLLDGRKFMDKVRCASG